MDTSTFWEIIEASSAGTDGDLDEQCEQLRELLSERPVEEIVKFQRIFDELHNRAYTWDLWGAAYVIGGGCSDDGFIDFRGWLIAKGQQAYESALADPNSLVDVVQPADEDCQFEPFQYVAGEVWCEKTGQDLGEFPRSGGNIGNEPTGAPWEEEGDDLPQRFPKLCEKFDW